MKVSLLDVSAKLEDYSTPEISNLSPGFHYSLLYFWKLLKIEYFTVINKLTKNEADTERDCSTERTQQNR